MIINHNVQWLFIKIICFRFEKHEMNIYKPEWSRAIKLEGVLVKSLLGTLSLLLLSSWANAGVDGGVGMTVVFNSASGEI